MNDLRERLGGVDCRRPTFLLTIAHNVHNVWSCPHHVPRGEVNVRLSPTHYGYRGESDDDGISIFGARDIWVDHCSLSYCADALIDTIIGSTAITISNSYFSRHDEVMLLRRSKDCPPNSWMQLTAAFNYFGEVLVKGRN